MEDKVLRYTLRVGRILFQRFRYIAESKGRSVNKEVERYIKKRVSELETVYGKVEISSEQ